jgi:hypothetical protein
LYYDVGSVDAAVEMYRRQKMWREMVRVVSEKKPDLTRQANLEAAEALEKEGRLRDAERHYMDGLDYSAAVKMYKVFFFFFYFSYILYINFFININPVKRDVGRCSSCRTCWWRTEGGE